MRDMYIHFLQAKTVEMTLVQMRAWLDMMTDNNTWPFCGLQRQSHPRILDKSDNDDDGDNSKKEDGWHDTFDAADRRITASLIEPTLVSTVIPGRQQVGRRKHSNDGLRKSILSLYYTVNNTS